MTVDAWAQHPTERFLARPMDAVRELRRCVTDLGFVGLRGLPWLWDAPPTDRRWYPLYAACVDLGVPFCTQVGHTGPLQPSEPGRPIPYIDQVALDFPELTIVCGHIGYPWTQRRLPRKVLFGSNFPMIAPADALRGLDSLDLDDEAREAFLDGNARRVFRL